MDDPTAAVTWHVDTAVGRDAKAVHAAVRSAARWLEDMAPLVRASVDRPVRIVVAAEPARPGPEESGPAVAVTQDAATITIPVSSVQLRSGAAALRRYLLEHALIGVETSADLIPPEDPPEFWLPPDRDPTEDDGEDRPDVILMALESLTPEELLVLGRLDGTFASYDKLDDDFCELLERSNAAELVDTATDPTTVAWTLARW
jgi:hypothetical protein